MTTDPTSPVPAVPVPEDERPGGWAEGIGWVAAFPDELAAGTKYRNPIASGNRVCERGTWDDASVWRGSLVVVVAWPDGTPPAPTTPDIADERVAEAAKLVQSLPAWSWWHQDGDLCNHPMQYEDHCTNRGGTVVPLVRLDAVLALLAAPSTPGDGQADPASIAESAHREHVPGSPVTTSCPDCGRTEGWCPDPRRKPYGDYLAAGHCSSCGYVWGDQTPAPPSPGTGEGAGS